MTALGGPGGVNVTDTSPNVILSGLNTSANSTFSLTATSQNATVQLAPGAVVEATLFSVQTGGGIQIPGSSSALGAVSLDGSSIQIVGNLTALKTITAVYS